MQTKMTQNCETRDKEVETSSVYCSPPSGINVFCHSRCFCQRWRNSILQPHSDMLECSILRRYMLSSGYPHMNIDTACSKQFPSPYTHNMAARDSQFSIMYFGKISSLRMNHKFNIKLILLKCYIVKCQCQ